MVIRVRRGTTLSVTRQFLRDGAPVDLTGGSVRFRAKWKHTDADEDAVVEKSTALGGVSLLDAEEGLFSVDFSASETGALVAGDYAYEVQATEAGGDETLVDDGALVVSAGMEL